MFAGKKKSPKSSVVVVVVEVCATHIGNRIYIQNEEHIGRQAHRMMMMMMRRERERKSDKCREEN